MEGSIMRAVIGYLFAVCALFLVTPVWAQNTLGFVGGLSMGNMSVDEAPDLDFRFGFGIGVVYDHVLSDKLTLRLEPMYLQKGAKTKQFDEDLGIIRGTFRIDYIELPVFLKFDLGKGTLRPYVMAGPTFGFNFSTNFSIKAQNGVSDDIGIGEMFKAVDFGLGFGGGVTLPYRNNTIFLEGRYILGIANVLDGGRVEFFLEQVELMGNGTHNGIRILAGINFPLGGQ